MKAYDELTVIFNSVPETTLCNAEEACAVHKYKPNLIRRITYNFMHYGWMVILAAMLACAVGLAYDKYVKAQSEAAGAIVEVVKP